MIIYCCQITYLDTVREELVHRNFQADLPSLFVRQMYSSPYGDGTFTWRNRSVTILFVRVVFFQQCFFDYTKYVERSTL